MIQDIAPKQYHNEFINKQPEGTATVLLYVGKEVCVKHTEGDGIAFPTTDLFPEGSLSYRYLFRIDEEEYFLGIPEEGADVQAILPEGFVMENYWIFRNPAWKERSFAGVTGYQLHQWYTGKKYCGRCGQLLVHDEKERMMRCPSCGEMNFPQICPAVIVAVTHKGKILMSKYANGPTRNFALLAGFTEIGETIEQTVYREVMEEVGVKVKNLRFYKSQPWSFTNTLLLGFFCELDGDDESITLDREELALAGWYGPEDVPSENDGISLTREMMLVFKETMQRCGRFPD